MSLFSIDFYRVDMAPDGINFSQIIRKISRKRMEDLARVQEVRGTPLRMQDAHLGQEIYEFDVLKIRVNDPAEKANLRGETESIPFEADEGLGDKTACFFHSPSRILLVQSNYYGPSASAIAAYFELFETGVDIQLIPLITAEGWQTISDWNAYRSIEIQTAGFGGLSLDAHARDISTEAMIRLNGRFGSKKSSIRFWMGNDRRGTLLHVAESVRALFGMRGSQGAEIEKIIVSGKDAGDEKRTIDLIKHRIRVQVPLGDMTPRHLDYQSRRAHLARAWVDKRAEAIQAAC